MYEKLVRAHVLDFLEHRISKHQHGFVKGKSCLSNLLETFDDILDILDEGAPVDLLYFDFSKAFDTVPHFRLLSKLEGFGVKGKVLNVIKDFLTIIRKISIIRKILFYVIIQSKRHLEQMKLYTWVVWLLFNTWPT